MRRLRHARFDTTRPMRRLAPAMSRHLPHEVPKPSRDRELTHGPRGDPHRANSHPLHAAHPPRPRDQVAPPRDEITPPPESPVAVPARLLDFRADSGSIRSGDEKAASCGLAVILGGSWQRAVRPVVRGCHPPLPVVHRRNPLYCSSPWLGVRYDPATPHMRPNEGENIQATRGDPA